MTAQYDSLYSEDLDNVAPQCVKCGHIEIQGIEQHYHDCPLFISPDEYESEESDLGAEIDAMHIHTYSEIMGR